MIVERASEGDLLPGWGRVTLLVGRRIWKPGLPCQGGGGVGSPVTSVRRRSGDG